MFALFGEIFFEALTSPASFWLVSGFTYAQHRLIQSAPRLQWLANELQKISLDLSFHVSFTNPAMQMNLLQAAAEDHQARALVFGNGVHRGYFVIESLEESHHQLADDGSYIAISARVELREWIPGADFDPLAPPRRTSPPPGIVSVLGGAQPIGAGNQLPVSAVTQLSSAGAGLGVMYSAAAYSQPGVSGIVGAGPAALTAGNPGDVSSSTIVRAG